MQKILTALLVTLALAPLGAQAGAQAQKPPPPPASPGAQAQKPSPPAAPPGAQPGSQAQKPAPPAAPPGAQTQKPAQPGAQVQKPAPPVRLSMTVFVTDQAGKPIPDVSLSVVDGPVDRSGTTDKDGTVRLSALKPGTFRLRFEAKSYIAFEREVAVRAGQPVEVEVTLNPAPVTAAPPPPVQPQVPSVQAPPVSSGEPSGEVRALLLSDWLDRNFISSNQPDKESVLGRTRAAVVSLLQVRDPLRDLISADSDQVLLVVGGEGTVRLGDREESVKNGSLLVIPRGTKYAIERRGRTVLCVLVVAAPGKP